MQLIDDLLTRNRGNHGQVNDELVVVLELRSLVVLSL